MTGREKISVIIPVYNVEKYLSACLNSCMQQTLRDVEFICVNDGSTDHSMDILREFQKRDSRISIVDKKNGGLSSARNAGIRVAQGQWLMFLDSDDMLSPNACERVWCETMEEETDIVTFGADWFPVFPAPDAWLRNNLTVKEDRFYAFTPDVLFRHSGSIPFVWRQAYRADFLKACGVLFDESVPFGEDTVFQLEVFPHGKNFAFVEDRLYRYRQARPGSLMAGINRDFDKKIEKHLLIADRICCYWQQQGWFLSYGKEFGNWMYDFFIYDIHRPDVKQGQKHLQALKELTKTYGFTDQIRHSRLWKEINR